ncbi:MAG: hypothetical protein BWX81_00605 [Spirochaetes bacterium ADurb.Bin110]|nr:MAG: hypothetical protein BWX81_00605 [Spirochaetes bacterium ADurb.Bin110]
MRSLGKIFLSLAFIISLPFCFISCIGIEASAKIDSKGAGTFSVEYQIAKDFVDFGLEESTPSLPFALSREDIERGLHGIEGISLKSYSKTKNANNMIVSFSLDFASPENLVKYLDPTGSFTRFNKENGIYSLKLSFGDDIPPLDPDMKKYISEQFASYRFILTIETAKSPPEVFIQDGSFISKTTSREKTILKCAMADLLTVSTSPQIDIFWR